MLKYRVASAIVLVPLVIGSVLLGGLAFFALVGVALMLAGFEFYQMARRTGHHPNPWIGLALIALILADTQAQSPWAREILTAVLVFSLGAGIFWHGDGWLVGWALTIAGALYVGWIGSYFLLVRALPSGVEWTGMALLAAWATDASAYLVGSRLGRHGFFTAISPKKTWEGAIAGWVAAPLTMLLLAVLLSVNVPLVHILILGLGIGITATVGDLVESLVKRQMGAKDSGSIIPGHGGLLDRVDSSLFAAAFVYYYLVWIMRVG